MISENDLNLVESNKEIQKEDLNLPMDTKTEEETNIITSEQEDEPKINTEVNTSQTVHDRSFIIEGKRSRKPTSRLEISELTPIKKELSIPQGHGKPLGEIEFINYQITHASTDDLSRMRNICYGRRGNKATLRKNLREFKGFEFDRTSPEYQKHLNNLVKLKKDQLKSISVILGLPSTGRNTDHAERILNFLLKPTDEGKKLPGKKSITRNKKRKTSTNSKESTDIDQKPKVQNGQEENGSDYNFKPGKKNSNKRSSDQENSPNGKRTKDDTSTTSEEENKSIEKPEELPNNTVENAA